MGPGARTLFFEQMGSGLDADFVLQRPGRESARRRVARGEIRQRIFHLHRLFVVPPITRGCPRRVSPLRQHGFIAGRQMRNVVTQSAAPFQGLYRFYTMNPEFRVAILRALDPARPAGAFVAGSRVGGGCSSPILLAPKARRNKARSAAQRNSGKSWPLKILKPLVRGDGEPDFKGSGHQRATHEPSKES